MSSEYTGFRLRLLSPLLGISAGSYVVLSLNTILAPWVALFWTVSCVLAFAAYYRGRKEVFSYRFRLITVLLLVCLAVAAHWPQGWQYVLAQALVVMLGIKLMELRTQRDAFQFCGLGVLGLAAASLVRFDLGFGGLILLFFFLGLVLILWQHVLDHTPDRAYRNSPGWGFASGLVVFALFLTVLTIILGLVVFFAFPRNISPALNLGEGMQTHLTGFSQEMSPGSVSEIVASNRIAFRAVIEDPVDPSRLYWRGAVLWETDGKKWTRGTPHDFQTNPVTASSLDHGLIRQSITLNPGTTEHLFGLYFPQRVLDVSPVNYNRDGTIKKDEPVETAIRYRVLSRAGDSGPLTTRESKSALAVPEDLDQEVVSLGKMFQDRDQDVWETAQEIMFYFGTQGFEYSLSAPEEFEQGQSLKDFLLRTRTGYCELYASAAAVLMRINDIPARVVVGFWGGEFNPVGEYWVVRDSMAHAWVEAWFQGRGWVLLDPTRMLEHTGMEEPGDDAAAAREEDGPQQVMSPGPATLDWLRWQWTNAIIDLTLARQVRMWRSVSSGIQDTWSGLSLPDLPRSWSRPDNGKLLLAAAAAIAGLALLLLRIYYPAGDQAKRLRQKAWKRLARKTPGRHHLQRPGSEQQVWLWWEENRPDMAAELKSLYHAQRYGPSPDLEKDRRLKTLLAGRLPCAYKQKKGYGTKSITP